MQRLWIAAIFCLAACSQRQPQEHQGTNDAGQSTASLEEQIGSFEIRATNSAVAQKNVGNMHQAPSPSRNKPMLSAERSVVEPGGLSVRKIASLMKSNDFEKFLEDLRTEAATDPLAQDLTAAEKKKLERDFNGRANIRSFACGLSICAGVIELGDTPAVFDEFAKNFLDSGPATASLLNYRVDLGNGQFEERFIISADPSIQGIAVPPRPLGTNGL